MRQGDAMVLLESAVERNEYKLVLVKSDSQAIWIEHRNHGLRLPRIAIPRWARRAEQLQKAVEATWHISTIVLDIIACEVGNVPCAVVEMTSSRRHDCLVATSLDEISEEELTIEELEVVKAILACSADVRGPFARLGWIQEAKDWIRAEVGYDIAFTDEVHQFNASPAFTLARFATKTGPGYWLKATGAPNALEFQITRQLARLWPEYLPRRIAAREDWNAWLMADGGTPLREIPYLATWKKAVTTMAMLQRESIPHLPSLLTNGCRDQRLLVLLEHLDEMTDYLEAIMPLQTSTRVPRLTHSQLETLRSVLQDACLRTIELEIPDTLTHGDINPGNILFDGHQCVFIDWAEAAVGNPLVSFEHLAAYLTQDDEQAKGWLPVLRAHYRKHWLYHFPESTVDRALALAPLLAVATYLHGRGDWFRSPRRNDRDFQAYARSLARQMHRQALAPGLMEAKWK